MTATRTDIHRPSSPLFDPEAYTLRGVFDLNPEWGDNHALVVRELVDQGYHFAPHQTIGQCGHCGAVIRYAALLSRGKELIYVGETCLDNRFSGLTKAEFQRLRKSAALNRERERTADRCAVFLADHPGLEEAFKTDHHITEDIQRRFLRQGSISDKQVALVFKLAKQVAEQAERLAQREAEKAALIERNVKVPNGLTGVRGKVLTVKWQDSRFGGALKMLVQSEEGWKVWGTVPSALQNDGPLEVGTEVKFVATLTRSDDDQTFGFFSRPRKAFIL